MTPMNEGLDLELFLQLLRADLGAWLTLGFIVLVLALMAWTSWGSRKALRKCLVLSIAAHVVLVLYGTTWPVLVLALDPEEVQPSTLKEIRVIPEVESPPEVPGAGTPDPDGLGRADRT